jgi:glutathione S-transferase
MMKLYVLPPSPRALKVIALKNHLELDCEIELVDLGNDAHHVPEFTLLNPNQKMQVLDDDGFILWESNAILHHLALKASGRGLWPSDPQEQSDVLRWLFWESAHWDQQACGALGHELVSKAVLRLGPSVPERIEEGMRNFHRFAAVLDRHLAGRTWLLGTTLTIADFALGAWVPMARALQLLVEKYSEIVRWYGRLASLPAWQASIAARPTAEAVSPLGRELAS